MNCFFVQLLNYVIEAFLKTLVVHLSASSMLNFLAVPASFMESYTSPNQGSKSLLTRSTNLYI